MKRPSIPRRRGGEPPAPKRKKTGVEQGIELAVIVAIAVALAFLVQAFVVKPYKIPSGSMEPTLKIGQRVLANRVGTHFGDPSVGDIVVFHPPKGADTMPGVCGDPAQGGSTAGAPCALHTPERSSQTFIKRVVALPGDTIKIIDGHAIVNGRREHDSYIAPCPPGADCSYPRAIRVPAGQYFMMGDNRGLSDDSRYWGPVPKSWIIGRAFLTYWPIDRIGLL